MPPYQIKSLTDEAFEMENDSDHCKEEIERTTDGTKDTTCESFREDSALESMPFGHQYNRVRFADTNDVIPVLGIHDYSFAEQRSSWFSPYEISQMKFYRDKLLLRLEKGKPCKCVHGKETTYRGLEGGTRSAAAQLHQNNVDVVEAVMNEQERQRQLGIFDSEAIASKIISLNEVSRERALIIGKRDEEDAWGERHTTKEATSMKMGIQRSGRSLWPFNSLFKRA